MASWTNSATEPVLELLDESDLALPPKVISYNLESDMRRPPSDSTISRAIRELRQRELIERQPDTDGYYRITDKGRAYLQGELQAEELENDSG